MTLSAPGLLASANAQGTAWIGPPLNMDKKPKLMRESVREREQQWGVSVRLCICVCTCAHTSTKPVFFFNQGHKLTKNRNRGLWLPTARLMMLLSRVQGSGSPIVPHNPRNKPHTHTHTRAHSHPHTHTHTHTLCGKQWVCGFEGLRVAA